MKKSVVTENEDDDESLVAAVLSGNKLAFTDLLRRYETRVRGYCRNMLGESLADDLAQEIFFKVFRSLPSFRSESKFSTWLYRIAANHCVDVARKEKLRRMISFSIDSQSLQRFTSSAEDQDRRVESKQDLLSILAELPASYRSLILMREVYGLSYEELAEMNSSSVDSIKAKLKRARQKLVELRKTREASIARESNG